MDTRHFLHALLSLVPTHKAFYFFWEEPGGRETEKKVYLCGVRRINLDESHIFSLGNFGQLDARKRWKFARFKPEWKNILFI